jgi:hypothetical protein
MAMKHLRQDGRVAGRPDDIVPHPSAVGIECRCLPRRVTPHATLLE